MRHLPFIALFASGCFTFPYATNFTADADIPEMDLDCDTLLEERTGTNGDLVFADVMQLGEVCRGRAFVSVTAVQWEELEDEIPDRANIDWREVLTEITDLRITANRGPIPAGVTLTVEQLLATESGELATFEGDWEAAVGSIGTREVQGSDTVLFAASHEFSGSDEENIAALSSIEYNEEGPLATLNESYANDSLLKVITLAVVDVPMSELNIEPTEITLEIGQAANFSARVRVNLLP